MEAGEGDGQAAGPGARVSEPFPRGGRPAVPPRPPSRWGLVQQPPASGPPKRPGGPGRGPAVASPGLSNPPVTWLPTAFPTHPLLILN